MSTFSDRIREAARNKALKKPAFQSSMPSITEQINLQQTGKATTTQPTGQSNIAEQIAVDAAAPSSAPTQVVAEQMAATERQADIRQSGVEAQREQTRRAMESSNQQEVANLLASTESSEKQLEQREDQQQLEQAATSLRLQDREYMANLERAARENQITDEIQFRETMQSELIGQNLDKILKEIDFSEEMARKERAATMEDVIADLARANDIMNAQMKDAQRAQMIGGVIEAGKAGIQYADSQGAFDSSGGTDSDFRESYGAPSEGSSSFGGSR